MERDIGGEYRRELDYWERIPVIIWKIAKMKLRALSTTFNMLLAWILTFALVYLYGIAKEKSLKKPDTIIPLSTEASLFQVDPFTIIFAPNNETVQDIVKQVVQYFPPDVIISSIGMENEKDVVKECQKNYKNVTGDAVIGLIFLQLPIQSSSLKYKIRDTRWNLYNTDEYYPDDKDYVPQYPELKDNGYNKTGAAGLQLAVDRTIIKTFANVSLLKDEIELKVGPLPQPEYLYGVKNGPDYVFVIISFILGWWSFTLLDKIILEKKNGVKELMKLVGVEKSHIWLGYWFYAFMSDIFVTLVFAMSINYDFLPSTSRLLLHSSFAVIWIFLLSFSFTLTFFTMLISTLFNNRLYGVVTAAFIWFLPVLIYVISPTRFANLLTFFISLTPYGPLRSGILTIGRLENEGLGATFSTLFDSSHNGGSAIATVLFVNIFLCVFYMLIAIYVEIVYPGKYGKSKPTNFIYLELKERIKVKIEASNLASKKAEKQTPVAKAPNPFIEPLPPKVVVDTQIINLNKDIGGSPAIRNLSMDIHKGEITVILGPEDSGKSTLLDVICGTVPATSGSIFFEGEDILKDSYAFRESLGYCPRNNYLFPSLTTWEHLIFYALLKGYKLAVAKEESIVLMRALGLYQKRHNKMYSLNAGLKRKLSLGIALIGDPKILVLDEPTTTIDLDTRKNVWDLLLQMRGKRTIIVTSSSLDEAEVLGDRIAFMDHGNFVCYGTSLFLKKALGIGYQITVQKAASGTDGNRILAVIQKYSKLSKIREQTKTEIHFSVPFDKETNYQTLFTDLENQSQQLAIERIGVTSRNMNELFAKVGSLTELLGDQLDDAIITRQDESMITTLNEEPTSSLMTSSQVVAPPSKTTKPVAEDGKVKGVQLLLNQLKILTFKSRTLTYRRLRVPFLLGITPVILGAIAMFISNVVIYELFPKDIPPFVKTTLQVYDHPTVLLNDESSNISDAYESNGWKFGALVDKISTQHFEEDVLEFGKLNIVSYRRNLLIAGLFTKDNHNLYFNNFHHHSLPISINSYTNSLSNISITTLNHPLYTTPEDTCPDESIIEYLALMWRCTFFVSYMIFMMYFMYYPAKERISGIKHVLILNNLSPGMYWCAAFISDLFLYLLVMVIIIKMITIQDVYAIFTDQKQTSSLTFIFSLYGVCGLVYSYAFSNAKRTYRSLCVTYIIFNIIIPCAATPYWYHKLNNFGAGGGFNVLLNLIAYFFPPFTLSSIIDSFLRLSWKNKYCSFCDGSYTYLCKMERGYSQSYLKFASNENEFGLLDEIVILIMNTVFWIVFLVLIEVGITKKCGRFLFNLIYGTKTRGRFPRVEDEVIAEQQRVAEAKENPDKTKFTLLVDGLVRNFLGIIRKFSPVKSITFATAPGECVGILGVSGSGKTTVMKILVGELLPSLGDAIIEGASLRDTKNTYLAQIGYSSEKGSFIERLTGKEMMEMLCIIQGTPRNEVEDCSHKYIKLVGLDKYKDEECITYSAGNKKKLCIGIAMMKEPKVLFLDELGTGSDPVSRLKLYQLVRDVKKSGRCVVMTASSMDECEAVCNKIAIIVNGVMRCLGNAQYIKDKYAQGYTIIIMLNADVKSRAFKVSELRRAMLDRFKNAAQLRDESRVLLNYYISNNDLKFSEMFSIMGELQAAHEEILVDYTISDTPLEEVFIDIAKVRG